MLKKENAMENNGMITLTKAEMLEEWKKRKGFYSGVRSCDVEREDGVDLDGVLQREMDDWYNKMLREAPSARWGRDSRGVLSGPEGREYKRWDRSCRRRSRTVCHHIRSDDVS